MPVLTEKEINQLPRAVVGDITSSLILAADTPTQSVGVPFNVLADAVAKTNYPVLETEVSVTAERYPYGDPRRFGAVGDGTTLDDDEFQNAVDSAAALTPLGLVELAEGLTFLLSAEPSNPSGVLYSGAGRVVKTITGGQQQLNSYADNQYTFGREYLLPCYHQRIHNGLGSNIVLTGDSTTEGVGASGFFVPDVLLSTLTDDNGIYFQPIYNRGQSGKNSGDWQATYLAGDLTAVSGTPPQLLIVRWGANDPYAGRTLAQFTASMRSCLTTIRATYNVSQMSILLMTPGAMAYSLDGRDERWFEQLSAPMRQMARDFQCCFYDTYGRNRFARGSANLWMDSDQLHAQNTLNALIYSDIADILYPSGLAVLKRNRFLNLSSDDATVAPTDLPATFPFGKSIHRADKTAYPAWPLDGAIETTRHSHSTAYVKQELWPLTGGRTEGWYRIGQGGTWFSWQAHGNDPIATADLTLLNSWVIFSGAYLARAYKLGNLVRVEGLIKNGTLTFGTIIATLPVGYRPPRQTQWFTVASSGGPVVLSVATTGDITIVATIPSGGSLALDMSFLIA